MSIGDRFCYACESFHIYRTEMPCWNRTE